MKALIRAVLFATVVAPHVLAVHAFGQSPGWSPQQWEGDSTERQESNLEAKRVRWPAPVRLAGHQEILHQELDLNRAPAADETYFAPGNSLRLASPVQPHLVIESPSNQKRSSSGVHGGAFGGAAQQHRPPKPSLHHPYHLRRSVQAPPPVLPGAKQRETWKMPYSYGYFGAGGTRHWNQHSGYRDRYTEWRLR